MNDLFDQIQLMRGDFAHVDGKMADFDNKISAVQDNVSNLKSEIMRTPSQDRGALYKSPPRRQFFGSSPPRGDRSKAGHWFAKCLFSLSPARTFYSGMSRGSVSWQVGQRQNLAFTRF